MENTIKNKMFKKYLWVICFGLLALFMAGCTGYTGAVKLPVRRTGNHESGHMETVLYAAKPPSRRVNLQDGDTNPKVLLFA